MLRLQKLFKTTNLIKQQMNSKMFYVKNMDNRNDNDPLSNNFLETDNDYSDINHQFEKRTYHNTRINSKSHLEYYLWCCALCFVYAEIRLFMNLDSEYSFFNPHNHLEIILLSSLGPFIICLVAGCFMLCLCNNWII